jgi:hypothetical protein
MNLVQIFIILIVSFVVVIIIILIKERPFKWNFKLLNWFESNIEAPKSGLGNGLIKAKTLKDATIENNYYQGPGNFIEAETIEQSKIRKNIAIK